MKIYVDKLPKSCFECPLRYYECDSYWCAGYEGSNVLFANEVKELNLCPLQSLAEHDKQVNKEVCEKIYKKCEPLFRLVNNYDNGDVIERNELVDILDQIQGDKNG